MILDLVEWRTRETLMYYIFPWRFYEYCHIIYSIITSFDLACFIYFKLIEYTMTRGAKTQNSKMTGKNMLLLLLCTCVKRSI